MKKFELLAASAIALIAATPDLARKSEVRFPYVTRAYDCRRVD